jgi:hypothetical protein
MDKKDERAKIERELDCALENTFPASDPPSIVQPHENEAPPQAKKKRAPRKKKQP